MSEVATNADKFELIASLTDPFTIDEVTIIRQIVPEDAEAFAGIIASNPDIGKYITWAGMVHGADDVVPAIQSRSNTAMAGRYAIDRQGSIVGYAGIFPGEQDDEYGMGYFVDKLDRGKGLAGEALKAMIEAVKVLFPKYLYLQIAPDNKPSITIATRYGFQPAETVWNDHSQLNERRFRLEIPDE